MTDTINLGLPCIEGSQAQKHVTHNEAPHILDTLVQLAVLDRDLTAPPGSLAEGQRWIVKATGTGAWVGRDNMIAAWQDGAWLFSAPQTGWLAYVVDEGALLAWTGSAWADAITALTSLNNMTLLGVGTTADTTNPFSAKLNNVLAAAKTVAEGGTGDLRYKLSKESAANTLSMLFQDNYSGRAEIGLTGDDNFHFKVSPDGSAWYDGIVINKTTGAVSFPNTSPRGAQTSPGGRLTLTSATPVLAADATAQQTVYYTPHRTALVPIYDGTAWAAHDFSEVSVAMAGASAWAAGSLYDWFVINDAGTLRLASGPAWSSTSARGTGAGTTELQMLNGLWTNKNAITARYGPSSTVTVAANQATYVGTAYMTANGQADFAMKPPSAAGGSNNIIGLWNAYNRVRITAICRDSNDNWLYTTPSWRAADNSNGNRISFVCGINEVSARASYFALAQSNSSTNAFAVGVGFDSTSAFTGTTGIGYNANAGIAISPALGAGSAFPGIGLHYVQAIEYGGTNSTFIGDNGSPGFQQSGLTLDWEY